MLRPVARLALVPLLLAHCTGHPVAVDVDGIDTDAATDALDPCAPGGHTGDDGACTSSLRWDAVAPFPSALDHHVTFVHDDPAGGAHLYVAGGAQVSAQRLVRLYADVRSAPIAADGTLGAWTAQTALPAGLYGAAVVQWDDHVCITGGVAASGRAGAAVATTYVSVIAADGTVGAWQPGPALPSGRFHHMTVLDGREVYAVGGRDNPGAPTEISEVAHATVGADGTLGPWSTVTPLPQASAYHAVAVHEHALYVTGGLSDGQASALLSVLRAAIAADGTLGAWETVGTMDDEVGGHSTLVRDGMLYVLGGFDTTTRPTTRVARAAIAADGRVGAWQDVDSAMPLARMHVHQRPTWHQWMYAVGGSDESESSTRDVLIGTFY